MVETWVYRARSKYIQVGFSNPSVGRDSTRYPLERGYRRIVSVRPQHTDDLGANDRASGYESAMRELDPSPVMFRPQSRVLLDAGVEAFQAFAGANLRKPLSSPTTISLLERYFVDCGIAIPQTCAVMGFGDLSISNKRVPSLTTVRSPRYEIGTIAAFRVIELLRAARDQILANTIECDNLLPYEIVRRESA
jgi:LacI family gluconate utilization system Gnt-I transcriptional repressor